VTDELKWIDRTAGVLGHFPEGRVGIGVGNLLDVVG
jgi:hypothetical protein